MGVPVAGDVGDAGGGGHVTARPVEAALAEAASTVAAPTLVLVGDQDTPFLPGSKAIADAIPGARLAVIPDVGHSPQFENPAAWHSVLRDFLDELLP